MDRKTIILQWTEKPLTKKQTKKAYKFYDSTLDTQFYDSTFEKMIIYCFTCSNSLAKL
jgi:hypothetical protein